jgi:hypothetical protein
MQRSRKEKVTMFFLRGEKVANIGKKDVTFLIEKRCTGNHGAISALLQ